MAENITTFHRAVVADSLGNNVVVSVTLNGWVIALCRSEHEVFALLDQCSHAMSDLSSGRIRRGSISCPLHGARFDLASGKCIGGAYLPIRTFPTRIADNWIEIAVPDVAPVPPMARAHTN